MPGFFRQNEYDIAGFAVGIVDRNRIIDGSPVAEGDILVGLASSVHTAATAIRLSETGT